jgi:hypothetical protein
MTAFINPTSGEKDRLSEAELSFVKNMPSLSRRFNSPQLVTATRVELRKMAADPMYNTNPKSVADGDDAFVARHLLYLGNHMYINPYHYISNLRIMTRVGR